VQYYPPRPHTLQPFRTVDIDAFLKNEPRVVNIGLEAFARELEHRSVPVVHVEWSPPAGGDPELLALLEKLGM